MDTNNKTGDSITLSRDMIYGAIIVVLVAALVVSVLTAGFGYVKTQCPIAVPNNNSNSTNTNVQPTPLPTISVGVGTLPPLGQISAPVKIVEISDYQCPFCRQFYTDAEAQLKANYVNSGKVKIYFRDLPLTSIHPNAMPAAIAARCADAQGKFWQMHDKLFDNQQTWSAQADATATFKTYATQLGLDTAAFDSCVGRKNTTAISEDMNAAASYGVSGTPGSFVIVPKSKMDEKTARALYTELGKTYWNQRTSAPYITLYNGGSDYVFLVPGAFPIDAFDGILKKVN